MIDRNVKSINNVTLIKEFFFLSDIKNPPNVDLCRETLLPLGIDFRAADGKGVLPFADASFDMVINRHGDFNPGEIYRVLKPGGLFITQQVGAENDRELVELLCGQTDMPFPDQYLKIAIDRFSQTGFEILEGRECFRSIQFYDVGALVWFARIIEWEFPDFSVDNCLDRLLQAQTLLDKNGLVEGRIHRFLLAAVKPNTLASYKKQNHSSYSLPIQ